MNRKPLILSALAFGLAVFAVATWFVTRPAPMAATASAAPEEAEALVRAYSPVLGPEEAPVTIVEFFDPACEACRAFYPVVKGIMTEHGETVRVVIRYTPFHGAASEEAIKVLEAARMQDVYEPVLEAVLREQPRWASHGAPEPGLILQIAGSAGLDVEAARTQMLAPEVVAILKPGSRRRRNHGRAPDAYVLRERPAARPVRRGGTEVAGRRRGRRGRNVTEDTTDDNTDQEDIR